MKGVELRRFLGSGALISRMNSIEGDRERLRLEV
jgi:hypothetical protein